MSYINKDGGPAFPESYTGADRPHDGIGGGMTLRDWFAGMALANLAQSATFDYTQGQCNHALAERSYALADAMLAEREKKR